MVQAISLGDAFGNVFYQRFFMFEHQILSQSDL